MLQVIMVTGESLSPIYQDGDYVLVLTIPLLARRIKVGDTIVFKLEPYGTLIKQVESINTRDDHVFVTGTSPNSLDSRSFGPIKLDEITGKVIWHIPKRRG